MGNATRMRRASSNPSMTGSPMSRRAASGTKLIQHPERRRSIERHLDLMAHRSQKLGQEPCRVFVVVDDEDALCHARSIRPARRRASAVERGGPDAGRWTMNSLPLPGPSLFATTLPPCSSTSRFTIARPSPRPPFARSLICGAWVKSSNTRGSSIWRRCPCRHRPR